MAQGLRALAALPEDVGSVPSTHMMVRNCQILFARNLGQMANWGAYWHAEVHADLQAHSEPVAPLLTIAPTVNLSSPRALLSFPQLLIPI